MGMIMEGFKEEVKLIFSLKAKWRLNMEKKKDRYVPDKSKEVENAIYIFRTITGTACQCGTLCTLERALSGSTVLSFFEPGLKKQ